MNALLQQMEGVESFCPESTFDIEFVDYEIKDGYCQIQIQFKLRDGFETCRIDWGDGEPTKASPTATAWHNYSNAGRYRVRIGEGAKWWRLWNGYTVDSKGKVYVSRPQVFPRRWGDFLESASGTYCGWSDDDHGGVQGPLPPWGKSMTSVFCCWQYCRDVTGGFPAWTDAITDATGAFDHCGKLAGKVPEWGRNIVKASQTYSDCPGATGPFPAWPRGLTECAKCYKNATGMRGEIPAWPSGAGDISSCFEGATGARGIIPAWPECVTDVSRCYFGCRGLVDAWTHEPTLLMPEEKVRYAPDSDYYRCYEVVTGCADSLRALFWDRNWGGTIPRPE